MKYDKMTASEHRDLEYMEMVHIEVEWQYIDVYKGEQ